MAHDTFGLLGRILDGALRIDRVAAAGGFSVVYRAFHLGLRACERVVMTTAPADGRLVPVVLLEWLRQDVLLRG